MGATTFLSRSRRIGPDAPVADRSVGAPSEGAIAPGLLGAGRGIGGGERAVARAGRGGAQQWTLTPDATVAMPTAAVQDLWLAMRRRPWRSVAVVPTWRGGSELVLAEQLVAVGVADTNRAVTLVSTRGVGVAEVEDGLRMVRVAMLRAELVVVVVDPLVDNPATAAVLRSLDAAVLTVRMGVSTIAAVERTVASAKPADVLGVVTRR